MELLTHWADFAKVDPSHLNPYVYLGESLWFNSFIQISNQSVFYEIFSMKGSVLIWPVVFCSVTRSSVWCHGGLGRSVPPVLNVLLYLFLLILKQQQIPPKCRLVEGCLYPILFCQYLDDI